MKINQNTANIALKSLIAVALSVGPAWTQQAPQSDKSQQATLATASVPESVTSSTQSNSKDHSDEFLIGNDDVLAINVWKEPEISRAVPVRSDGKISLPLVGEVQATGKTPKQLQAEITSSLQAYMSGPEVTVIVQEIKSQKFNILGRVARPGSYLLTPPMTVLDAIALAGGFLDFAKSKDIYVLRRAADGSQARMPFNYKQVIKGTHSEQNVKLEARDTVVVP
jgi:polysaccharide biosynthesis/export protein